MEETQENCDVMEDSEQESLKRTAEEVIEESEENQSKKLKLDCETGDRTESGGGLVEGESEATETKVENDLDKESQTQRGVKVNQEDTSSKPVKLNIDYTRKKKCALLLSYCGSGYNGMQRNPGVRTIEEDLADALLKANAISEDAARNFGKHMVPSKELIPEINKHLEPQVRVFALKQVTRGFDCKNRCSSRSYEYILPTFAFSKSYAHTAPNFRITSEIMQEINDVLSLYKGTHNFHNFTSGRGFKEESSKRYMMSFKIAGEPFVEKDMEFVVLQVQGQSFMQHQIRKMIGLFIAIIRNCTDRDAIERSFEEAKMDIPKAPGLGLVLDQVHFKSYNERFGKDGFHEPLEWSECEDKIVDFKKKFIYNKIIETEVSTKSMMRWLNTLSCHTYSSAGMLEPGTDKTLPKGKEDASSPGAPETASKKDGNNSCDDASETTSRGEESGSRKDADVENSFKETDVGSLNGGTVMICQNEEV